MNQLEYYGGPLDGTPYRREPLTKTDYDNPLDDDESRAMAVAGPGTNQRITNQPLHIYEVGPEGGNPQFVTTTDLLSLLGRGIHHLQDEIHGL